MRVRAFDELPFGFSWTIDRAIAPTSHALAAAGRVWLVDPTDAPAALDRVPALGTPAAVIQLLDRHGRACEAVAERFGVPLLRVPDELPGTPFEVLAPVRLPGWKESALWWAERRALVVAEVIGTSRHYTGGGSPAGIHPLLRAKPPGDLRDYEPEHLLVGHGEGLHGPAAAEGVRLAYERTLRDIPRVLLGLLR